jgi:hypothetical protein
MANTLTSLNAELWSKRMQLNRQKLPVYMALANREEQAALSKGDVMHRDYRNNLTVGTYTKSTDVTDSDLATTDESLTVDQTPYISFTIDDIDKVQNSVDAQMAYADDASKRLAQFIDADFLAEIVNASSVVDDADFGGTSGVGVTVTTSNILKVFTTASTKLARKNVDLERLHAVLGPTGVQTIIERLDGKDTPTGDEATKNGMNGRVLTFAGFTVHRSNNLYYTATWTPANNPSDGDTVTIGGVVFTFKTTPVLAGAVDIGGSTAASIDNLVAAINGGAGAGTDYIAISGANRNLLMGLTAVDGTTNLQITWNGGGEAAVSASETADVWSAQLIHWFFGQQGAVDMVEQIDAKMKEEPIQKQFGIRLMLLSLYGLKTYLEGANALVQVKVDASSF